MKERSFEQILEEMNDSVNKPNHYCGEYGLESIDVIRNFAGNLKGVQGFYWGNAIKYLCRFQNRKPERSSGLLLGKCYQISL